MASPDFEYNNFSALEVQKFNTTKASECVTLVKFTDEINAALQKARVNNTRIRITVTKEGGVIKFGSGANEQIFRFSTQSMTHTPTDVVAQNSGFRSLGTVQQKFQVQATEQSFEDTRQKAMKLHEAEQSRMAKEVTKHARAYNPHNSSKGNYAFNRRSPMNAMPSSSRSAPLNFASNQKIAKPSSSSAVPSAPTATPCYLNAANRPSMSPNLKAELMRRSIRSRIIHLIVTQRYSSVKEVYEKLRRDGLPEKDDSFDGVVDVVEQISDAELNGRLVLKSAVFPEVDLKWPWFTTEEKANLRRAQQQPSSSHFAPSRKSGADRASRSHLQENKGKDPDAPPAITSSVRSPHYQHPTLSAVPSSAQPNANSMQMRQLPNVGPKKVSPQLARTIQQSIPHVAPQPSPTQPYSSSLQNREAHQKVTSLQSPSVSIDRRHKTSPSSTKFTPPQLSTQSAPAKKSPHTSKINIIDELLPPSHKDLKRKAHEPLDNVVDKKNRAIFSAPPPPLTQPQMYHRTQEFDNRRERERAEKERQRAIASRGGSTGYSSVGSSTSSISSRLSSPILAVPMQPSQDYNKQFSEAGTLEECNQYYVLFHQDYPLYVEVFQRLQKVSKEFQELGERLEYARLHDGDIETVEKTIYEIYSRYEKDEEFMRARQLHTDLRSKLDVLKRRIAFWQERNPTQAVFSTK